jgi:hypothetical protein
MRFPKSLHADGWHTHLHRLRLTAHDDGPRPPRERRGLQVLGGVVAIGGLLAIAGLHMAEDPRPLDEQASLAMRQAGETLRHWQAQLSRGLQVSLRAVADGRELPASAPAPLTLVADALPPPAAPAAPSTR